MADRYRLQETEIKVLDIEPTKVFGRLSMHGAIKKLECINQTMNFDIYGRITYGSVPASIKEIIQMAEALAARGRSLSEQNYHLKAVKTGNHYQFVLKYGDSEDSRMRAHTERLVRISVNDWMNLKLNLLKAGLRLIAIQEHRSTYFELNSGKVKVEVIDAPGLPTYMVLRSKSEKLVYDWIRKLDLESKNSTTLTGQKFFE